MYSLDPQWSDIAFYLARSEVHPCLAMAPFCWQQIYIYEDNTRNLEAICAGVITVNGHCTYLLGNQWILNDTYRDKERLHHPFLYHVSTGKRYPLADLLSPKEFHDEFRCDTHPRYSPNGRKLVVDSPHAGGGRQLYLLDISSIVESRHQIPSDRPLRFVVSRIWQGRCDHDLSRICVLVSALWNAPGRVSSPLTLAHTLSLFDDPSG